jgi:hypothetical protein
MATRKVPGIHYSVTPEAQRLRREWLEPERVAVELRKARDKNVGGMEYVAAIGLIRMTDYLQVKAAEQLRLIDQILATLDEVTGEQS